MNFVRVIVLLAIAAIAAGRLAQGYKDRAMPLLFIRSIRSLIFRRDDNALYFWGATTLNAIVVAFLAIGSIILATSPGHK